MAKFSQVVLGAMLTPEVVDEIKSAIDLVLLPAVKADLENELRELEERTQERATARLQLMDEEPHLTDDEIDERIVDKYGYEDFIDAEERESLLEPDGIRVSSAEIGRPNGAMLQWDGDLPDQLHRLQDLEGYEYAKIVFGSLEDEYMESVVGDIAEIGLALTATPFQVAFEIRAHSSIVGKIIGSIRETLEATVTEERLEALAPSRKVFIGHGGDRQWEAVRRAITDSGYEVEAFEQQDRLGRATLEQVIAMVRQSKVAIIVMSATDEQKDGSVHARQNVIHELGLAQGILGPGNTVILKEDKVVSPSNLAGITELRYRSGEIHTLEEEIIAAIKNRLDSAEGMQPRFPFPHYPMGF